MTTKQLIETIEQILILIDKNISNNNFTGICTTAHYYFKKQNINSTDINFKVFMKKMIAFANSLNIPTDLYYWWTPVNTVTTWKYDENYKQSIINAYKPRIEFLNQWKQNLKNE
jgi:hypothetical protein